MSAYTFDLMPADVELLRAAQVADLTHVLISHPTEIVVGVGFGNYLGPNAVAIDEVLGERHPRATTDARAEFLKVTGLASLKPEALALLAGCETPRAIEHKERDTARDLMKHGLLYQSDSYTYGPEWAETHVRLYAPTTLGRHLLSLKHAETH